MYVVEFGIVVSLSSTRVKQSVIQSNVAAGVLIVTLPKDEQFMDVRSIPVSSEALPPGKEKEEMVETLKE